jgi:hypothetical protein
MSIDSCNFCEEEFKGEKSYKLLGKNWKLDHWVTKEYITCYKCFVSKYKLGSELKLECPVCIDYKDNMHFLAKTNFKLAFHQDNCKTCGIVKCSFGKRDNKKTLNFCGNCEKCCQKVKYCCNMCKGKYNKRYCDEHNYQSMYRCDQEHCKECCKKAHICMICDGTNNERFKFDWKGTFHPSCLKKKGSKLECIKCNKKYGIKSFYYSSFRKKICKKCIICVGCKINYSDKQNNITEENFEKTNILLCINCIKTKRVCYKCRKHNDTKPWQLYILCQKCLICEKCGKNTYYSNCNNCDSIIDNYKKTGQVLCC